MTEAAELLALRVEAASGPDRILDYEIRAAIRGAPLHARIVKVTQEGWETVHYEGGGVSQGSEPRAYTASLDAAMSLVPEGWKLASLAEWIGWVMREKGAWRAALTSLTPSRRRVEVEHAATPALALTAAALRARAHIEQEKNHAG